MPVDGSAIVSGGTGGLGVAVTRAMLDAGWQVVVPYIVESELQRLDPHERLVTVAADLFDGDGSR